MGNLINHTSSLTSSCGNQAYLQDSNPDGHDLISNSKYSWASYFKRFTYPPSQSWCSTEMASNSSKNMLRPPINRAMRTLDRAFFRKTIPLAAASFVDPRLISECRKALEKDVLAIERVSSVVPAPSGKRALLLREGITEGWSFSYDWRRLKLTDRSSHMEL